MMSMACGATGNGTRSPKISGLRRDGERQQVAEDEEAAGTGVARGLRPLAGASGVAGARYRLRRARLFYATDGLRRQCASAAIAAPNSSAADGSGTTLVGKLSASRADELVPCGAW
jgi:hypothetical protein